MTITLDRPAAFAPAGLPVLDVPGEPRVSQLALANSKTRRYAGVQQPPHGHRNRYKYWGCRCDRCTASYNTHNKMLRAGLAESPYWPVLRVTRQFQALAWMGYTTTTIAERAGLCLRRAREIQLGINIGSQGLHKDTVVKAQVAYNAMIWEQPPDNAYTVRCRNRALKMGFQPPEAWDDSTIGDPDAVPFSWQDPDYVDPVEVDRIIRFIERHPMVNTPRKPALWGPMNREMRVAVLRRLAAKRMPLNPISLNLGCSPAAIQQWAQKRSVPAVFVLRTPDAGRFVALGEQLHIEFPEQAV